MQSCTLYNSYSFTLLSSAYLTDSAISTASEYVLDMIAIATNDALKKIEKEINNKLGNQAGALGGLL